MIDNEIKQEILESFGMSQKGRERWFNRILKFCSKHGGERYYKEIIDMVNEYKRIHENNLNGR